MEVLQDIRIVIIDKEIYKAFRSDFISMRANWSAGVATRYDFSSVRPGKLNLQFIVTTRMEF